ncbi:MAG: hypothetical protein ACOYD4_15055 [Solirubrobacterales bacterium]
MRIASLWEPDGDALELKPELKRSEDAALKERILGFLQGGGLVLRSPGLRQDRLDPTQPPRVPLGYLSDGEWIWPLEMVYYLERHGILPEEGFLEHMRARGYEATEPAPEALARASRLLGGD